MHTDFLKERFHESKDSLAFIIDDKEYFYKDVISKYNEAYSFLNEKNIVENSVVAVEADFSPMSVGMILALADMNCIIIPLTNALGNEKKTYCDIAHAQYYIKLDIDSILSCEKLDGDGYHDLYNLLKERQHSGIIFFTSGSTGISKGAVHDFVLFIEKFKVKRKTKKMITFLMFDHVGGINTLMHNLSGCGCTIALSDRKPQYVLSIIEKYKVQVLPTSPTFINLILVSELYKKYNLSSLEAISYGSEVMPEYTLKKLNQLFPSIKIVQSYGMSELGVLDTKSKSNNSLWVKLGRESKNVRIKNGMLEIKGNNTMLGYLNAPSPFTEDGWLMTMDMVEQDGEYYKILGRKSEIINVGGEKVYPAEVESFFLEMPGVEDVAVRGEQNPLMGNIVFAKFKISTDESKKDFQKRMREFAKGKLVGYKIPQQIELVSEEDIHSVRLKKDRK